VVGSLIGVFSISELLCVEVLFMVLVLFSGFLLRHSFIASTHVMYLIVL
jgi:hypothetical protein